MQFSEVSEIQVHKYEVALQACNNFANRKGADYRNSNYQTSATLTSHCYSRYQMRPDKPYKDWTLQLLSNLRLMVALLTKNSRDHQPHTNTSSDNVGEGGV